MLSYFRKRAGRARKEHRPMRIPLTLATLLTVMILILSSGCSRKTPAASYDLLNQTCARDTYQLGDLPWLETDFKTAAAYLGVDEKEWDTSEPSICYTYKLTCPELSYDTLRTTLLFENDDNTGLFKCMFWMTYTEDHYNEYLSDRDKIKDLIDQSYPDAEKNAGYITAADGSMIQVEAGKDIQPEATEDQWILIVTIMGQ